MTQRHPRDTYDLDPDHCPRREACDPGGTSDAIVNHDRPIRTTVDPERGHADRSGPEPRDLLLKLVWVGPAQSAWRNMERTRVHIKELGSRHPRQCNTAQGLETTPIDIAGRPTAPAPVAAPLTAPPPPPYDYSVDVRRMRSEPLDATDCDEPGPATSNGSRPSAYAGPGEVLGFVVKTPLA
jgi:hypothetical protein